MSLRTGVQDSGCHFFDVTKPFPENNFAFLLFFVCVLVQSHRDKFAP
jgi:hypothetical protein